MQLVIEFWLELTFTIITMTVISKFYLGMFHPMEVRTIQAWNKTVGAFSLPITLMLALVFAETFLIMTDLDIVPL